MHVEKQGHPNPIYLLPQFSVARGLRVFHSPDLSSPANWGLTNQIRLSSSAASPILHASSGLKLDTDA